MKLHKLPIAVFACLLVGALGAQAAVSEAYLFSDFSSPPNASFPPFTFTGTDGVRLFLNGSGVATNQSDVGTLSRGIASALTYVSNSGTINSGEGFAQNSAAMGGRVNSEIGKWDDVGFIDEGPTDAALNVDFSNDAQLVLALPSGSIPYLIVAEDAGLDPFKLEYSANGTFSDTVTLFNGFDSGTTTAILGRSDFGGSDSGDIDQAYLFIFDQALSGGAFRITETDNLDSNSSKLEVDFVGTIPEPNTVMLVASGLGLLGTIMRRRRS
jgi:hypothetical protein